MSNVTMREMLEAGVHFGHQARFWNPKMAPYLFGQKNKIHIINLEKSLPMYGDAVNFISKSAAKGGTILFVGTKRAAQNIIEEEARRCDMPFVSRRWLGGLLTNFKTVRQSIKRLKDLESMAEDGTIERLSKKDLLIHNRELEKLERSLSGIKNMQGIPDALFVVDVGYEYIAVNEAKKLGIPVIGVVDSNNDPEKIDYIIPGNDDAIRSIRLYAKGIADAVLDSRQSVAHLGEDTGNDDFIELDESGKPVAGIPEDPNAVKVAVKKVASKKKVIVEDKKETVKKAAAESSESPDATVKTETKKKTRKKTTAKKKKVVKKKVASKKTTKKKTATKKSSSDGGK